MQVFDLISPLQHVALPEPGMDPLILARIGSMSGFVLRYGRQFLERSQRTTRRTVLKGLVVSAGAAVISRRLLARSTLFAPDYASRISTTGPGRITEFDLHNVRLLDVPFREAQVRDHQYLLSLDPARLLLMFRITAGVRTRAKPLGGWESPSCELRGHTLGHYLSACSLMYASTGDPALKTNCDMIVSGLPQGQAAMLDQGYHTGYLSAFPESFFDRVEVHKPIWAPYH